MNANKKDHLVRLFLDFGEAMLKSGAEISRVETSLKYFCSAYTCELTDVFVITASIVLTVQFTDGDVITMSRRIEHGTSTDYTKLHRLNQLCRQCCKSPLPPEELEIQLNTIADSAPRAAKLYAGSAIAAGAFTIFFGGSAVDALLSALFALFICFFQYFFMPRCPNKVFFLFVTSLLCGIGICTLHKALPLFDPDLVIIGDIMLLVPGIAITTAVHDMLIGDTISGSTKLMESLLHATALAAGFMIAILLLGR